MTTEDGEQIREALERLKNSSMEIGKAIYSNTSSETTEEPAQEAEKQESTEEKKSEEGEQKSEDKEKKWAVGTNWEHC